MCKSVRSAAFFGSSVHVIAAFVLLMWFLLDTVVMEIGIRIWKCEVPQGSDPEDFHRNKGVAYFLNLLFKFIYYILLATTGIYIFRGVDRANARLLKFSTLAFVVLQIVAFILFIVFAAIMWNDGLPVIHDDESPVSPVPAPVPPILENESKILTTMLPNVTVTVPPLVNGSIETLDLENTTATGALIRTTDSPEMIRAKIIAHNQMVSFTFQVFGVVFNVSGSIIYAGVLIRYLITL